MAVETVVQRILGGTVNQPGAFVDPPPRLDAARKLGVPVDRSPAAGFPALTGQTGWSRSSAAMLRRLGLSLAAWFHGLDDATDFRHVDGPVRGPE